VPVLLLLCSADKTARKERIRALVTEDPVFARQDSYFNDRPTQYKRALEKMSRAMQRRKELGLSEEDSRLFKSFIGDALPVLIGFGVLWGN